MCWKLIILSLLTIAAQCEDLNAAISSVNGYRTVAYFVNWAIYGNFTPQDLPTPILTHVLYAFADINADTGEVFLSDTTADIEKPLSGDSSDEAGNNLHGCLEQLYLLKKLNRALKVLLSIGGWTYSPHFASPASTSQGRSTFALSVVSLVKTYGFDGVDIDWDYPTNALQAADMISLLQEVRTALDGYGDLLDPPYHFTLTVACPGPYGYQYLNLSAISQTVDFLNVMAYDYTGPWSETSGDQANLFPSSSIPASTPFNTEAIISYISQSIRLDKITLGVPLYGRAFNNTGGPGEQFSGSRTYDFKELPLNGCAETNDNETGSSYCYGNRELISYDSIPVVRLKAAFIQNKSLGGAMFWESSMDSGGDNSIIQTMAGELDGKDGSGLDSTWNQLLYPDSPYDNIMKTRLRSAGRMKRVCPSPAQADRHTVLKL
ncbi:glycoside hydrolase family 18 protein [Oidiodendron maius Zn]|uniref:chitinase n=1 Tax=Oidiodendron maius (strain Zn) TaxID=913774 RepID=A0A0C3CTX6_OIDMZ|nr:glycoside hydrolase family 18 protein [Oidiodendron maius Zn]